MPWQVSIRGTGATHGQLILMSLRLVRCDTGGVSLTPVCQEPLRARYRCILSIPSVSERSPSCLCSHPTANFKRLTRRRGSNIDAAVKADQRRKSIVCFCTDRHVVRLVRALEQCFGPSRRKSAVSFAGFTNLHARKHHEDVRRSTSLEIRCCLLLLGPHADCQLTSYVTRPTKAISRADYDCRL